jgi:hypothetical protein
MPEVTLRGGPLDGQVREIPDGYHSVSFSTVQFEEGPLSGRPLGEWPDIRFDPETFEIVAPRELVPQYVRSFYVRSEDGFVYVEG